MFTVGLVGKYYKPRHLMRSLAILLFFAIHIKELLSHLPLLGKTFKMTFFTLEEIVSRYERHLFPGLLRITLESPYSKELLSPPSLPEKWSGLFAHFLVRGRSWSLQYLAQWKSVGPSCRGGPSLGCEKAEVF